VCTTKAEIPTEKAIFPVFGNLSFLGCGDPWEENRTLQLLSTLYYDILHNSLSYTILVVICERHKIQTPTAPKGPPKMETNVRFEKSLRDFEESALGIYISLSFSKKRPVKVKIGENWKDSFSGGYLSFRGTHLSFHFQ